MTKPGRPETLESAVRLLPGPPGNRCVPPRGKRTTHAAVRKGMQQPRGQMKLGSRIWKDGAVFPLSTHTSTSTTKARSTLWVFQQMKARKCPFCLLMLDLVLFV